MEVSAIRFAGDVLYARYNAQQYQSKLPGIAICVIKSIPLVCQLGTKKWKNSALTILAGLSVALLVRSKSFPLPIEVHRFAMCALGIIQSAFELSYTVDSFKNNRDFQGLAGLMCVILRMIEASNFFGTLEKPNHHIVHKRTLSSPELRSSNQKHYIACHFDEKCQDLLVYEAIFTKCTFRQFEKGVIVASTFEDCDLTNATFQGELHGVIFKNCNLTGANFSKAVMSNCQLIKCITTGAIGLDKFSGKRRSYP